MQLPLPAPNDTSLWGWRWMARWYALVGLPVLLLLAVAAAASSRYSWWVPTSWRAAHLARTGQAMLMSYDDAPHIDPDSGLVVVPVLASHETIRKWNAGVLATIRREGPVLPTWRDRIVDPRRIAAEFNRDPGTDVADGLSEFPAGECRVRIEEYDRGGCGTGVPNELRCGARSIAVDAVLRVRGPDGRRRRTLIGEIGRGEVWFPWMASMRARTSDDGRTLWLRGTDIDGGRWIATVDLVTGTLIQFDPDPAG